jgi:cytochrome bd-type quinol oxidase subunit 1
MVTFTLLYGVLAVIEFGLMVRTIKVGTDMKPVQSDESKTLTMAY